MFAEHRRRRRRRARILYKVEEAGLSKTHTLVRAHTKHTHTHTRYYNNNIMRIPAHAVPCVCVCAAH